MYPKVKVRSESQPDHDDDFAAHEAPTSPRMGLKALDFLSLYDYESPVQEHQVFRRHTAKINSSFMQNFLKYPVSKGTGETDTRSNEDCKPNIRASTVPRPRAVLSSPDNDLMIGKKNRKTVEPQSALKCLQSRNGQSRTPPKEARCDGHKNTRKPRESVDSEKISSTRKKATATASVNQRTRPPTKNPTFVRV